METPCKDLSSCPHKSQSPDLISFQTPVHDTETNQLTALNGNSQSESSHAANGEGCKAKKGDANGDVLDGVANGNGTRSGEDEKKDSEKVVDDDVKVEEQDDAAGTGNGTSSAPDVISSSEVDVEVKDSTTDGPLAEASDDQMETSPGKASGHSCHHTNSDALNSESDNLASTNSESVIPESSRSSPPKHETKACAASGDSAESDGCSGNVASNVESGENKEDPTPTVTAEAACDGTSE